MKRYILNFNFKRQFLAPNLIFPLPVDAPDDPGSGKNSPDWNLLGFSSRLEEDAFASDRRYPVKPVAQMVLIVVVTKAERTSEQDHFNTVQYFFSVHLNSLAYCCGNKG
jgi:hypothetical protein